MRVEGLKEGGRPPGRGGGPWTRAPSRLPPAVQNTLHNLEYKTSSQPPFTTKTIFTTARLPVCPLRSVRVWDLRLIDSCITQLKAQGPSRTCNESKEVWGCLGGNDAVEQQERGRGLQLACWRRLWRVY